MLSPHPLNIVSSQLTAVASRSKLCCSTVAKRKQLGLRKMWGFDTVDWKPLRNGRQREKGGGGQWVWKVPAVSLRFPGCRGSDCEAGSEGFAAYLKWIFNVESLSFPFSTSYVLQWPHSARVCWFHGMSWSWISFPGVLRSLNISPGCVGSSTW